ncbi:glycosyltransferase family 2 protein [Streptomyces sp. NRRL S-350]|uniref:glycosyltransferase family 2 protein n=1 Tax=Streptomyces sp. NRRL S-350 TaxID=1463902 RepID=UPI00068CF0FA|nr:glycosyltransferase family 2 protein [Streptomyces sp. NRRL S-350]
MLPEKRVFDDRRPLLSVVVPCYNESEVLPHTHARLTRVLASLVGFECELIYVDDGSTDGTWDLISSLTRTSATVRALKLSRNFGHQRACLAGLREATGDAVAIIDADLQDPPELIGEMAALWSDGWSVVSARRRARSGETLFKKASAYAFYRLLNALSDQPHALDTGDFRLVDRTVVELLTAIPEKDLYLRGIVSWFGLPETSVAYDRSPRHSGESKYTLRKMLSLARHGLLGDSAALLRLPVYLGSAALAYGVTATVARRDLRKFAGPGAFGAQALALGVMGEYVHAVHRQLQGRPAYVVEERITSVSHPVAVKERVGL